MIKRLFTIASMVAMVLCLQAKEYKYVTVKGDLMNTRIYTLDNGLKVYLSVNKEKPRIQANIAVRTGSRNDPAETTGLAHYLEHIMFKGTKQFGTSDYSKEAPFLDEIERKYEIYRKLTDQEERRKCYHEIDSISQLAAKYFIPNEYDKLLSSIGAQGTNAYTSNDVTCYVEDIPANEVENWAKIQADRFQNMVIRGFHTELEAVYEEFNMSLAKDSRKMWQAFNGKMFPSHPYGTQSTIGTQEHLKNPSITNIKEYFKRYYVPNNVAICMAGDLNPDEVMAIIDKYFGSWKKSDTLSRPEYAPMAPLTQPIDTTVIGQEAEYMMMGWRFNGAADAQNDTLNVIASILANGKAGIFEINLEQQMKLSAAGAFCNSLTDYSTFMLYGYPKANQSLDEVRQLLLGGMAQLKAGDFSDDLLPSVINNRKLQYYRSLSNNESRVDAYVDAFINNENWEDVALELDRISKITKQQIVDFANKYFNDNYVCAYKVMGTDSLVKKIEKPAITPIPTNRDLSSDFLNEIKNTKTEPIKPRFLDFKKDLTVTKTTKNIPLLYKHNAEDGLFNLTFNFDFGTEDVKGMDVAAQYLNYIGTESKTATEIKQEFYKLACNYSINIGAKTASINLSGLNENLPQALALLEEIINKCKGDSESYSKCLDILLKERADAKTNQSNNFSCLREYGMYGDYNSMTNVLSENELRNGSHEMLTDMIKAFSSYKHTILYYGPYSEKEISSLLKKQHTTAKKLAEVPQGREYTKQPTPANEVVIAPYVAKNIYLMQYHNENKTWSPEDAAVQALFNSYFGSGMNAIVFQELREARGLAYSAAARYSSPSRKGEPEDCYTYIISQNDKMTDCINVFNNIIDTIPQSESAFEIAKQSLIKSIESRRVTKANVLFSYLAAQRRGIDYDINEKVYNDLPSLTLDDIVEFEKQNMAKKTYKYLILGNEKELDMDFLGKIGPIKRVSTEDIFGY